MDEYGILLYGFDSKDAETVRSSLEHSLRGPVLALSASGGESRKVSEILDNPADSFIEGEVRILMFLGFRDSEIREALSIFPKEMKRPIFCTLTENNGDWTFSYLLEHLEEEHRQATARGGR